MKRAPNLIRLPRGARFGLLTIIRRAGSTPRGSALWLCRCDCGNKRRVWSFALRAGLTRSCGCGMRQTWFKPTHGYSHKKDRTYSTWCCMRHRCANPANDHWANYGGRGIRVTQRWLGKRGFQNFLKDMGPRPDGRTLDRKDVNGNYCKRNCRWATATEQAHNRRCSVREIESEIGIA